MNTHHDRLRLLACAAVLAVAAIAVGPGAGAATLLSSSIPGAFGVRYLPDRAVVTCTVEDPGERGVADSFRLSVWLPQPVRWGYLDGELLPSDALRWDADEGQVTLALPFGGHRIHLGWAGEPSLPPDRAVIPVIAGGEEVGRLVARFSLDGMEATGEARLGPGTARVRLVTAGELDPAAVSLTSGGAGVGPWRPRGDDLLAPDPLMMAQNPSLTLQVRSYGLSASPIDSVAFDDIAPPTTVQRVPGDELPDGAVLVEAEDFVDAGGTPVLIGEDTHVDTHGGACVYTFVGDGSWLEWEMAVPAAGEWDLYARISCGDTGAFRQVALDGMALEGLGLVAFPATGGWGHAEGEWWLVRLTGAGDLPGSLELTAGTHRLRVTGVLEKHLNFDYVALVPHE